ncbi:glycosyltransferase family 4 protein [Orrella sp. NBD-18]|uniref:Glycosyltransferase family 4 protein n=1 Tax=Sheuella amnicola TaxID=2707330 RepID=A0A6B2R379_9BURK|nr:glycosyltransferase family 1 protein [Sheuella amnicola]NDY83507.1 glycosyltransferase family 4 protein [Sheuella amnicola]
MRIVIDLQGIQNDSRFRGIGRYSIAFAKALIRHRGHHEIIVLLSDLFPESIEQAKQSLGEEAQHCSIKVWSGIGPTAYLDSRNNWRRQVSELLREAFIENLKPDVLLISSVVEGGADNAIITIGKFTKVFTSAILYDLIPLIYKKEYLPHPTSLAWYEERVNELKKADFWFAISESSRTEGIQHLGLREDRVVNISAAIGEEFNIDTVSNEIGVAIKQKLQITKPFLMYSGAFDPRKNIERLIEAYDRLPEEIKRSHQLVLAGGIKDWQKESIKKKILSTSLNRDDVIITDRISDEELSSLYRMCKAYILPTYHEGFGLTALEAMACGAPVIGSNASSVPEVIGLDKALFDPFSVKDMTEKIRLVLSNQTYRDELLEHGSRQVKNFSWNLTAIRALEALSALQENGTIKPFELIRSSDEINQELFRRVTEISKDESIESADLKIVANILSQLQPRQDPRPRLYIDISELHERDSKSGIQRVVRSIIHYLLKWTSGSHRVELVYATEFQTFKLATGFVNRLLDSVQNEDADIQDDVICPQDGDIFLGLDFQDRIAITHEEFYDYFRSLGIKFYFVVYDLLPISLKSTFSEEVVENYSNWLRIVAKQDGAICISRTVANELQQWVEQHYPDRARSFKVDWFHLGADIQSSIPTTGIPLNGQEALELISAGKTFLTVGTMEPRKCHEQILDAFDQLWNEGQQVSLVIVGRHGWLTERLATRMTTHEKYGSSLFWYEVASDEFLEKIYEASSCLIAASQAEGFGLPLIEAAQHGLPIIARDIPVFREVAQDGAFYFAGNDADSLATAIKNWLILKQENQIPESKTIKWQSWEQSSKQLLNKIAPDFFKVSAQT